MNEKLMEKAMSNTQWFFDTIFNDFNQFSASFFINKSCKIHLRAEDWEKRKTLKTLAGQAKIKVFHPQKQAKTVKKYLKW